MRVYWQYRPNDTGKGWFTARLVNELEHMGVHVQYDSPTGCDVTVSYTYFRDPNCSLPKLLRVDGLHMVRDRIQKGRDTVLASAIREADGVVWQSMFCRRLIGSIVGVHENPARNFVIYNGSDMRTARAEVVDREEHRVLMAAKWFDAPDQPRKWKRLSSHLSIAHEYARQDPMALIWVAGVPRRDMPILPRVEYLGWLDNRSLMHYMDRAHVFVYAPWFDWCPNAAVEAMCARCHLICSPNGGQGEIADGYGTVVRGERDVEPEDLVRGVILEADIPAYVQAIRRYFDDQPEFLMNPAVDIGNVAREYRRALEAIAR